jgi:serine/threonine protein kinase
MNPRLASTRTISGLDPVERAVFSFEQEWRERGEVRLDQYWPDRCRTEGIEPHDSMAILAELIKADLRLRYDDGQSPTVASYLEQFPELCQTDSRVVSLIYEEFCLMEEGGRVPDVESFCGRYPRWKDSLTAQLQYHRLFSQAAGARPVSPQFPNAGDCFEEFQLVSLLGRGGTSRVFLARDLSLGGKQVVLKVSHDRGDEPKVHGRLDHPHIVPANSVAFQPDKHLRGLSMPYHPGLALDVVMSRLYSSGRPRKAIEIWHVLVDGSAKSLISSADPQKEALLAAEMRRAGPRGDGWEGFPASGTFAQGAAWLAMIVARALHYAHGMGTYHRDVKPGNILLTLRHGPELFDFNLSESPHSAHQAQEAIHGGTLPYMAPEQIEAFLNPQLWGKVGAQADVYSLGLVLRELLTGQMPELPEQKLAPARAMRQVLDRRAALDTGIRWIDPKIPHALESIVAKSLSIAPKDRYGNAEALAKDLERFLRHEPLLQADNRSRREKLANWGIRKRWFLLGIAMCVLALAVAARRPIIDRLTPPVESLPRFQDAVRLVNAEEADYKAADRAIGLLKPLLWLYPDSPLVRSYLAFAYDLKEGKTTEAGLELGMALSTSRARRKLLDWGKTHPEIGSLLENLAVSLIEGGDNNLAVEILKEEDEERVNDARRQYYDVAKQALDVLEGLGYQTIRSQTLLAKIDDFRCDYDGAFDKLSRLLDTAKSEGRFPHGYGLVDSFTLEDLFACHALRCRVAINWVDHSRNSGRFPDRDAALKFLKNSEQDDLKYCEHFFERDTHLTENRTKKFAVLRNKLGLAIALGEIEIESDRRDAAAKHLKIAKETMTVLGAAVIDCGLPAPKMLKSRKRLGDAEHRLATLEQVSGSGTISSDLRSKTAPAS